MHSEEERKQFWQMLTVQTARWDIDLTLGDLNARVGQTPTEWVGDAGWAEADNPNGEQLLKYASEIHRRPVATHGTDLDGINVQAERCNQGQPT